MKCQQNSRETRLSQVTAGDVVGHDDGNVVVVGHGAGDVVVDHDDGHVVDHNDVNDLAGVC